jgi:putative phage-type endonuclease
MSTWTNPFQRTPEWFNQRRGKITGSRVARVVNGTPRGWQTFAADLEAETMPDFQFDRFLSQAVELGKEYEPVAIANAELTLAEDFAPVGFVTHPEFDYIGASSDFLAYDGMVNGEVKCPSTLDKHMAVKLNQQMPREYFPQVQLQMAVHNVLQTLFISYYVGPKALPMETRLALVHVQRDDRYIREMLERCHEFQRYRTGKRLMTSREPETLPSLF